MDTKTELEKRGPLTAAGGKKAGCSSPKWGRGDLDGSATNARGGSDGKTLRVRRKKAFAQHGHYHTREVNSDCGFERAPAAIPRRWEVGAPAPLNRFTGEGTFSKKWWEGGGGDPPLCTELGGDKGAKGERPSTAQTAMTPTSRT